jgi:hypothetical protein
VVPLALLTVIFVAYAVTPYLTLDPARGRTQPMPPHASYYPLLVTHIFLGSIALLAASLQVWPWLRRSHPAVHRWSGRVYVTVALSASVCVMIISPMGLYGPNQRVANTMLALLWFVTTLAGFSSDPAAPHCRPPAMDAAQFCAVLFDRGLQSVDVHRLRNLCAGDLYRR